MIKATPKFMKLASKFITTETLQGLVDTLSLWTEKGVLIKGTDGIRKIRWKTGKNNKGKSGGVRILYYYQKEDSILLITLFRKSDQENIDESEKLELKKLLSVLLRSNANVKVR